MFRYQKEFQYNARPDKPDPILAKQMQEILGGQWGEISVMMNYLFQGWNCRAPMKYRDLIINVGTEEIGHVEMIATMIARLLETSPVEAQEAAAKDGVIGAVLGGSKVEDVILGSMNPQHALVSGGGALPADSMGIPWNAKYTIASGNLLADFRFNVTAESQGRLQVARLYNLTDDSGVKDMLQFLLARDTMHQNMWLAAIQEIEEDGLDATPCPMSFPEDEQINEVAYKYINFIDGENESLTGRWASGPSVDGKGEFETEEAAAFGEKMPDLDLVDPRLYGTLKEKAPPMAH